MPDKVTASGFVASQVDGAQVGGWPAALMAELPAKEERWCQLGYANHRDWRLAVEKSSDATRQGQRASIAACQMVPRPRQLASLLPRHQWCPLGSAARTTRPAQRACCANGSMIIAGIRIRHPRRRACWPATPASKSRSWINVRRSPRRAPSHACGAPNAFMHVPSPWYRVYESKAAQLALSKRRRQAAAHQGDDGKLVPRRRWQTADSSGSGPVTCE